MTISKATKILDYYFDEKTKHHEGIFSLEKSFSQKDPFEIVQLMRKNLESELVILKMIRAQYTSKEFRKSIEILGIKQEYIWHHTPEQNGHVESFHKTLKKEYIWPHEFTNFQMAEIALAGAFQDYNNQRIHSSVGYMPSK